MVRFMTVINTALLAIFLIVHIAWLTMLEKQVQTRSAAKHMLSFRPRYYPLYRSDREAYNNTHRFCKIVPNAVVLPSRDGTC